MHKEGERTDIVTASCFFFLPWSNYLLNWLDWAAGTGLFLSSSSNEKVAYLFLMLLDVCFHATSLCKGTGSW
jgi:hypothetical protein